MLDRLFSKRPQQATGRAEFASQRAASLCLHGVAGCSLEQVEPWLWPATAAHAAIDRPQASRGTVSQQVEPNGLSLADDDRVAMVARLIGARRRVQAAKHNGDVLGPQPPAELISL